MITTLSGVLILVVLALVGLRINKSPSATYPMTISEEKNYDLLVPGSMIFTTKKITMKTTKRSLQSQTQNKGA
jgi:hypothetical protein